MSPRCAGAEHGLFYAVSRGDVKLVERLVERKADPLAKMHASYSVLRGAPVGKQRQSKTPSEPPSHILTLLSAKSSTRRKFLSVRG